MRSFFRFCFCGGLRAGDPFVHPGGVDAVVGGGEPFQLLRELAPYFRLTDGDGMYLHYSCLTMVKGIKDTWSGTEPQLNACRKAFPLARDLTERVIEK